MSDTNAHLFGSGLPTDDVIAELQAELAAANSTPILRDAMVALHDKLANIELDLAEASIEPNQDAALLDEMQRRQEIHDRLAKFFDWNVYLDRQQVAA